MSLFLPLACALWLGVGASLGWAALDCDRPSGPSEMAECAGQRLRAAEREMSELYGQLLDNEDKDFVEAVRQAQEAWMRWREAEGRVAAKTVNDQALARYAVLNQQAQMTEDRVKDLRGLLGN